MTHRYPIQRKGCMSMGASTVNLTRSLVHSHSFMTSPLDFAGTWVRHLMGTGASRLIWQTPPDGDSILTCSLEVTLVH